jgi:predicted phage terminase large subunit-like protein
MEARSVVDKVARASTVAVFYSKGQVFHPLEVEWLVEWEEELLKFPLAKNDDQVDNASMAGNSIAQHNTIRVHSREEARAMRGY